MQPDAGAVVWIAGGMGTALTIIGAWAWNSTQDRINEVKHLAENKADGREMDRQRDNIKELFDLIREHEQEDRARHEQLLERIVVGHEKILEKLNERRK